MDTAEIRTIIGNIRLQLMQSNITKEDAKSQLQSIDLSTAVESSGITILSMQNIINDTINAIDQGKL